MKAMNAADELAMVRARIAQLRAREQELREALIGSDPPGRQGRWAEARVIEHRVRHFDHRLLPFDLQADPLFWRERVKTEIELALRGEGEGAKPRARQNAADPGLSDADVAVLMHGRPH